MLDTDGPALSLSFSSTMVSEVGGVTATVTRNTPTGEELVVSLTSGDLTEATVPATVVIPQNESSVTFAVSGVQDHLADGPQDVAITAEAAGYSKAVGSVIVTDIDLPDLRPMSIGSNELQGLTGEPLDVTWTVTNQGLSAAGGSWTDRVYLSVDNQLSGDDSILTSLAYDGYQAPLEVGQSYTRTRQFQLPSIVGSYYVIVLSDASGFIQEGSEFNNTLASTEAVQVDPAYRATVVAGIHSAPNGTTIPLDGNAFRLNPVSGDPEPAPDMPVTVRISVNGTRRVLNAVTDANGNFHVDFHPLPYEAGHYTVCADHPGVAQDSVQDEFRLLGVQPVPDRLSVRLTPGMALVGHIDLVNLSDVPLTGLSVAVLNAPANLQVSLNLAETLEGSATTTLDYSLTAADATLAHGQIRLHITSAEAPARTC